MYVLVLVLAVFGLAANEEILSSILQAKESILKIEEDAEFITIWNFDNTILDGDSSEGRSDREASFKGLGQVAIEAGFSKKYPPQGGFAQFMQDYEEMEKQNEPKAYAYMAQMLAGAKEKDVLNLALGYFRKTLKSYLYKTAVDLIRSLQENGIKTYILTASPQIFVQGAGPLLNIPLNEIFGMQSEVKNGLLTDQMVLPLTTRQGKVEKIKQIVGQKKIYVLAGFGNNNENDMVFLKWIASQTLPAGKPLGVIGFKSLTTSLENFSTLPLIEQIDH